MNLLAKATLCIGGIAGAIAAFILWRGGDITTLAPSTFAGGASKPAPGEAKVEKKAAPKIRIVNPEPSREAGRLSLSARTAAAELAIISSRATGVIAERRVDIGDRVEAGGVLAVIEAPEIEQELLRARASVAQNKARLALARQNVERADVLAPKGHLSEQARDERRANRDTTEADVNAAEAEVRRLEEVQKFQTVRAPFAGTIVDRRIERGDKVSGEQTQTANFLFRIARLDELRVEIDVPQSAALRVRAGSRGDVTFAELPGETFQATVVRSSGLIDPASSTMRMELSMPNPGQKIPAGLNGQVSLALEGATAAVTVPANTLVVREGRQSVATVNDDEVIAFRQVRVGRDLGQRVEIVGGLSADDRVVLSPNALLRDGDKVEATAAATAQTKGAATAR